VDICPCLLTNRFIKLVNGNFKSLKYFKLNNYCGFNGSDDCQLFSNTANKAADFDYESSIGELSMDCNPDLEMDYSNSTSADDDNDDDDDNDYDDDDDGDANVDGDEINFDNKGSNFYFAFRTWNNILFVCLGAKIWLSK
jgi:hypothetical protein